MSLLCVLHWSTYATLPPILSRVLWSILAIQAVWIVAARNHYTLDVVVSWHFVWFAYHSSAERLDMWIHEPTILPLVIRECYA